MGDDGLYVNGLHFSRETVHRLASLGYLNELGDGTYNWSAAGASWVAFRAALAREDESASLRRSA